MAITAPPTAPSRNDSPATFSGRADALVSWLSTFTSDANTLATGLAGLELAAPSLLALSGFRGNWSAATNYNFALPFSVYHNSTFWVARTNSGNLNQTPADGSAYWARVEMYHSVPIVAMAALDVDCTKGSYFQKTIAGNSIFTFSGAPASRAYSFTLELTHTSGTVTWPASVRWPDGITPTLVTGKTHLFTFTTSDAGVKWFGAVAANYTS